MKTIAPHVARVLLGLVFFVFGLNGFFHFIPQPPAPESVKHFTELMTGSYLFSLVKGTEVVVGLALLSNRFVALALLVLAPITVNIFMFHAAVAGEGLPMPIMLLALQGYLAWVNRAAYAKLLTAKSEPAAAPQRTGKLAGAVHA